MTLIDRIQTIISTNTNISASELAENLGVSRQRVYQICSKHGIKFNKTIGRKIGEKSWADQFGNTNRLPSNFIGNASELTVAADLLRHGIPVYRALTQSSSCDLIVDVDGSLLRIEVRSAKRNIDGVLRYAMPADRNRYDVLALVESNCTITYKPEIY